MTTDEMKRFVKAKNLLKESGVKKPTFAEVREKMNESGEPAKSADIRELVHRGRETFRQSASMVRGQAKQLAGAYHGMDQTKRKQTLLMLAGLTGGGALLGGMAGRGLGYGLSEIRERPPTSEMTDAQARYAERKDDRRRKRYGRAGLILGGGAGGLSALRKAMDALANVPNTRLPERHGPTSPKSAGAEEEPLPDRENLKRLLRAGLLGAGGAAIGGAVGSLFKGPITGTDETGRPKRKSRRLTGAIVGTTAGAATGLLARSKPPAIPR